MPVSIKLSNAIRHKTKRNNTSTIEFQDWCLKPLDNKASAFSRWSYIMGDAAEPMLVIPRLVAKV
jgi:hypothetical protein